MAELRKFLDQAGVEQLVVEIKGQDAKTLEAAKSYADGLAKNYDASGSAATAEKNAKDYTDGKIAVVNENVDKKADKTALEAEVTRATGKEAELQGNIDAVSGVANQNKTDIAAINNETTGILAQAKADATEKANAVQANVDALVGKVGEVPEGQNVMGIIQNIQENAYDDTELRGLISGLDSNKADKTQVATDISTAVKAEEDARKEAVAGVQGAIDALSGTHATDKAALEASIALKADQTALDEVADDVAEIAGDYLKKADKEELQGKIDLKAAQTALDAEIERATGAEANLQTQINTIMNNPDAEGAINSINEFEAYVREHGTIADGMRTDINKNKEDIAAHVAIDHDFAGADASLKAELVAEIAKKSDKTTVEGIDGRLGIAEGKVSALEEAMDEVEGAVATKAEQSALNKEIEDREAGDAALDERLQLVEAQLGDGENSVSDLIADAKQEAITTATETAAADATAKANKALEDAKKYADAEDAKIESRVDALEGATHTHTNKALLDTYTQTEANLADAVAKKHEHANKAELDKIADGDVAKWNSAESNAKSHADSLNTAMTSRVDGIDGRVTANANAVATKAEADDLDAAVERIEAVEASAAANASAIASITAIPTSDITAMFA